MLNTLQIRTCTKADLPQLLLLYQQLTGDAAQLSNEQAADIFDQSLKYEGTQIFIGVIEDVIVSTSTIIIVPNLTRTGSPFGLIENVVPKESHRKLGHGRAVLNACVKHAWSMGCYKVMLLTGSNNPATRQFYSDSGFKQDKTGFQIRRIQARS